MPEGEDWTLIEVEAAVASYREMLCLELLGASFNKLERNRALQKVIQRNKGSIEFKHANISAVLNEAGLPYIVGYKPRPNAQGLLRHVVKARLVDDEEINELTALAVARNDFQPKKPKDLLDILVSAPSKEKSPYKADSRAREEEPVLSKRNWIELEARNSALGAAGELLVMEYEHERLWCGGHRQLAERIEHSSLLRGDGLGYDIHSFEEDGKDRLIEVKTTQFGQMTPFFASKNEVNVSSQLSDFYQVYRLFAFRKRPKLFVLEGAIGRTCEITPVTYSAVPW